MFVGSIVVDSLIFIDYDEFYDEFGFIFELKEEFFNKNVNDSDSR